MKASEFIKEHGLNKAKALLSTNGKTIANLKSEFTAEQLKEYQGYIVSGDLMSLVELKRLVESHELIEKCGGLDFANLIIGSAEIGGIATMNISHLKQAISDVESCQ